jgi:GntR family transcriptional regulator
VKRGYPLIHLENVIYTSAGRPAEYASVMFRGDRIKIEIINTYDGER